MNESKPLQKQHDLWKGGKALPGWHINPDRREEEHAIKDCGSGEELILEFVDHDVLPVASIFHGRREIHFILEERPVDLRGGG